jgi:DNA-binding transcriptional MerR regulator
MTHNLPSDVACSIAEISRCYGLSLRAIRLYEDRGLVSVERDRLNRRRYGRAARERLAMIARLRLIGLGVAEIRALLEPGAASADTQRRRIVEAAAARLARLQADADRARAVLADLQGARFGVPTNSRPALLGEVA